MKRSTKYQRICDAIKNDIRSGYYSPGEKLPSERKLSQHYNAAHATINKAVRELVTCGFLSKVDSLGTFVTKLDSSETPISGKYCLLAGDPGKSGEFGEIAIALLNGIMSQAAACGMRTQLVSTTDLHNELLRYSLFPQSLAGVIFWNIPHCNESLILNCVEQFRDIRFVLLNYQLAEELGRYDNFYRVYNDDAEVGALAARHLLKNGHQEFAVITFNQRWRNFAYRADGFRRELERCGISNRLIHQYYLNFEGSTSDAVAIAQDATEKVLKFASKTTGFFTINDYIAVGIKRALRRHSENKNLELIACDNAIPALSVLNGFSTVAIDFETMGKRAVETLTLAEPPAVYKISPDLITLEQQKNHAKQYRC
ncbi:MAG: GntR family transcriptional regulator [Lentisphaeria bacterium]|nr:GntR family transcriptional regulator [Lentisphaeria bacterium]